jgi:carbon monoxide dehydrogenase subunit G
MEMSSERLVPAAPQAVWDALNDPETLRSCIAGCEKIDLLGPDQYEVGMAIKIGPVSAKFKGKMSLQDIVPPQSYAIVFEGQGGMAGFAKGSAMVRLAAADEGTMLHYEVNAQVGGKLAQLGSRLIESSAKKMADDFFAKFVALFQAEVPNAAGIALETSDAVTAGAAVSEAAPKKNLWARMTK